MNPERLAHAKSVGFEPVDLTKSDRLEELIEQILGVPEVDASIDAVGFEARGHGTQHTEEAPATVLNALMTITRAGGAIGIPGLYVTEDPGSADKAAQQGNLRMRFGLGWAKSHRLATGQTPVLRYNRQLMQAILHDRAADREDRQCHGDHARSRARRVPAVRQGRGEEVRARSARRRQGRRIGRPVVGAYTNAPLQVRHDRFCLAIGPAPSRQSIWPECRDLMAVQLRRSISYSVGAFSMSASTGVAPDRPHVIEQQGQDAHEQASDPGDRPVVGVQWLEMERGRQGLNLRQDQRQSDGAGHDHP